MIDDLIKQLQEISAIEGNLKVCINSGPEHGFKDMNTPPYSIVDFSSRFPNGEKYIVLNWGSMNNSIQSEIK